MESTSSDLQNSPSSLKLRDVKSTPLDFRPAQIDDASAIADLVNSAYRGESSKQGWTTEEALLDGQRTDAEMIAELIRRPDQIFLLGCDSQGTLVTSVQLQKRVHDAQLSMLTVRPDRQDEGLGRQVIEFSEKLVKTTWGVDSMAMSVINLRSELIAFYERRGYRRTGESHDFPFDDARFGLPKRRDFNLLVLSKTLK